MTILPRLPLSLFLWLPVAVPAFGAEEKGLGLEVRALANEGFLLTAGDAAVVIDAFVAEPYSIYGALSGEPLARLESGTGPFALVDLALTSHRHGDHFQRAPARRLLAARDDVRFVGTPQVLALLADAEGEPELPGPPERVRSVWPEPGEEEALELDGITVGFLRLSHGSGRFRDVQNLGHVVTLGGVTALHVGDAAMVPASFAAYGLRERGIDVVFVPYWYFDSPAGRSIVEHHFRPAELVACHVPPRELADVKRRLATSDPDVHVPERALQLFRFRDEH